MPISYLIFCKRPYTNVSANLKTVKLYYGHFPSTLCKAQKGVSVYKIVYWVFCLIMDSLIQKINPYPHKPRSCKLVINKFFNLWLTFADTNHWRKQRTFAIL